MDLTAIFRILHLIAETYTFLSSTYGILSRIENMIGHKSWQI
jgi:hypothetical protein